MGRRADRELVDALRGVLRGMEQVTRASGARELSRLANAAARLMDDMTHIVDQLDPDVRQENNADLVEMIAAVYTAELGRTPDPAGLVHWLNMAAAQRRAGASLEQIRHAVTQGVRASPEYRQRQQAQQRPPPPPPPPPPRAETRPPPPPPPPAPPSSSGADDYGPGTPGNRRVRIRK
ncbi:MAG: hypothetical protein AB2A00_17035 [Myxococcota bacterium]